jgi:hypothetical protein
MIGTAPPSVDQVVRLTGVTSLARAGVAGEQREAFFVWVSP